MWIILLVLNKLSVAHCCQEHDKVRFPCEQCDYQATKAHDLKRHIEARHLGVRWSPLHIIMFESTKHFSWIHIISNCTVPNSFLSVFLTIFENCTNLLKHILITLLLSVQLFCERKLGIHELFVKPVWLWNEHSLLYKNEYNGTLSESPPPLFFTFFVGYLWGIDISACENHLISPGYFSKYFVPVPIITTPVALRCFQLSHFTYRYFEFFPSTKKENIWGTN